MEQLPSIKLIENDIIEVFANYDYDRAFLERLVSYYTKREKDILEFFKITSFRKVRVNLFNTREQYYNCFSKVMKISKYGIGNCYMGSINYVCTQQDLETIPKAGFVIASIVHELVHLVYSEKINKSKIVWLEEGLAQYLSGQKSFLEQDVQKYNEWLQKNIFEKEIPKIEYLKKHGSTYGSFCDIQTNKYNGYDISYALIRYMIGKYNNEEINKIIRSNSKINIIEENIIQYFLNETKKSAI